MTEEPKSDNNRDAIKEMLFKTFKFFQDSGCDDSMMLLTCVNLIMQTLKAHECSKEGIDKWLDATSLAVAEIGGRDARISWDTGERIDK